ncbi:MAG: PBECR4 domain-containing protein [Lactobacillus crispatus]|uniref:PBECR4 domain-containing protein n=1 Tax=Lactobacillus crispatus TaxID=47770 RepID=UPI002550FBBF|nr:PBECR4 domain-containing protein [Lactobacillus crispatus]MDK6377597.1 PBECR4 domain-containing protein [Lactobacillus crispatus]MDK8509557.1 PBECR4 domain-containing protein [Lactobacillus crispatus]
MAYRINNLNDVDYLKILQDYRQNFAGKVAVITTNYKKLCSFKVSFSEQNLPHLMGWQKVIGKNSSATNIIRLIDNNEFTLANTRKNSEFFRIKDRLLNYNFLHDIFYGKLTNVCIMTSDMKPNKLKLDIVFYHLKDKQRIIVLGLRKRKNTPYFVPTTLHVEKIKNNPYLSRRKTSIKSFKWI